MPDTTNPYSAPTAPIEPSLGVAEAGEAPIAEATITFRIADGFRQIAATSRYLAGCAIVGTLAFLPSLYLWLAHEGPVSFLLAAAFGLAIFGLSLLRMARLPAAHRKAKLTLTEAGLTLDSPGSRLHLSHDSIQSAVRRSSMLVVRQTRGFTLIVPLRDISEDFLTALHRRVPSKHRTSLVPWIVALLLFVVFVGVVFWRAGILP